MNLFLVLLQLRRLILELLLLFGQFHALGCAGVVDGITELGKLGAVTLLLFMYIVGAKTGEKIALIAVHIAQRLEAVLFAAVKEPVDWALLIGFQVVGIEVIQEVAADHLAGRTLAAERVGNKLEVFFQRIIAIDLADELHETPGNVIVKILVIANGNDIVVVRDDGLVFAGIPFAARIGKSIHVQRIPPKHAAHGIGDEGNDLVAHGADVVAALHGLRHIVFAVKHAMHGHILLRHVRRQFVLQTVNVNKNAVEFLFVLFELLEALFALGLPGSIFLGNQSPHIIAPSEAPLPFG